MDEIVAFLGQEECRNLVDGFPAKGTALANLNDLHGRGLLGKSKIGRKFYLTWPTIYPT